MCRRCFQTFERCTKLLDTVKSNVKKAVSTLQLQDSFSGLNVRGRNIPLDLHQEHLNRTCKESIECLGANKTEDAIVHCGKALGTIHTLLNKFDMDNSVADSSLAHQCASQIKDISIIIKELQQSHVFDSIPGRKHHSFK